jgi:hypothetical protein
VKPLFHVLAILVAVFQPRVGERRKVGIVTENVLRALVFLELYKPAFLANIDVQGIVGLPPIQVGDGRVRFTKRR